jgi:glycyl-tRNA synthetase
LPKALAPVQVAVFPLLQNHEGLVAKAKVVAEQLRAAFTVQVDASGAVGRRYRRQDEIGTPFCVTVDHQTLADDTVTIRERDTMKQERAGVLDLAATLQAAYLR